jgi:hypothetical protein
VTPGKFRARFDRIDAFRERRIGIAIIEILVGTYLLLLYRGIIRPLSILMTPSERRDAVAACSSSRSANRSNPGGQG